MVGQTSTSRINPGTTTIIDKAVVECIYDYIVDAPYKDKDSIDKKKKETYITILQANSSVSKYWDWYSFKEDSINYFPSEELSEEKKRKLSWKYSMEIGNLFTPVVIKNFPNGKITVIDNIPPDEYFYEQNKAGQNWVLKDDTLTVCGYLCNTATTSFGGRTWTAWYAPEITISDGPWKLYGLPGLILKARDSSGTHAFEATVIRKTDRPIYLPKNVSIFKIDKEKFISTKNKFEEDPLRLKPKGGVLNIKGVIIIGQMRAFLERKTKYCPLELE
jgi:GLPGLI family protein